jgi:ribosome-associated protein
MTGQELALAAARIMRDKLADEVVVLDLRSQSPLADWFVMATASSTVHAQALARSLAETLKKAHGERAHHVEGDDEGEWILLDYLDVVVHIFLGEVRQFYGLERLWGDVPRQTVEPDSRSGD